MSETIALLEEIAGRPLDVRRRRRGRATSGARRPTRRGIAAELGWQPTTPLEDGLDRAVGVGLG